MIPYAVLRLRPGPCAPQRQPFLGSSSAVEHSYSVDITIYGQTVILISPPPRALSTVVLEVNGIAYRAPLAFLASETSLKWTGGFSLDPSDDVHVSYF